MKRPAVPVDVFRSRRILVRNGQKNLLSREFAKEGGGLPSVMPAKAGIQDHLIFLDSGSRLLAKAGITLACPE